MIDPINSHNLINTAGPEGLNKDASQRLAEEKKKEVAKNFESILVGQLVDQMKDTIGSSGLLEEQGSKQIQDMFFSFLAKDVSKQGGIGLWKQIYQSMNDSEQKSEINVSDSLDSKA
ncbi:flagellar rod assembly protein/muramidase FlgJ [Anaerohalosphaera lusitana]|uniref:Flagellar rod assembly protein/muramidase FlgJ n=1 Tax=Anaerohalosphaera lusitana TaxID=1936003 RepID=A0A1U9NGM7_9BACT|nr:rod-binding protein [Anaerohalosphaera lusitana]AQT66917.1 flagellar rod assembly protein/muramidase FlgJ [Anaerohalosphaera lusitana]